MSRTLASQSLKPITWAWLTPGLGQSSEIILGHRSFYLVLFLLRISRLEWTLKIIEPPVFITWVGKWKRVVMLNECPCKEETGLKYFPQWAAQPPCAGNMSWAASPQSFLDQCQWPRPSAKKVLKQKPAKCGHTELFIFGVINNGWRINIRFTNVSIALGVLVSVICLPELTDYLVLVSLISLCPWGQSPWLPCKSCTLPISVTLMLNSRCLGPSVLSATSLDTSWFIKHST